VHRMCELAGLSRATFYRDFTRQDRPSADQHLRDAMQKICLKHRAYGYRRVQQELRRDGQMVDEKKLLRMMREDNLLAIRQKAFRRPKESGAKVVFPNLLLHVEAKHPNEVWVSDITYIRLRKEFVYLAVILDRYTRRVVGWQLGRHMDAGLTLDALRKAIEARRPAPGLIHHSDQGVQYGCSSYCLALAAAKMLGSMSAPAWPWHNAVCESFMATLKKEEIYCHEYATLEELLASLEEFIDRYYNRFRLHSALGYQSPVDFELRQPSPMPPAGFCGTEGKGLQSPAPSPDPLPR
jgi:putative transposase